MAMSVSLEAVLSFRKLFNVMSIITSIRFVSRTNFSFSYSAHVVIHSSPKVGSKDSFACVKGVVDATLLRERIAYKYSVIIKATFHIKGNRRSPSTEKSEEG